MAKARKNNKPQGKAPGGPKKFGGIKKTGKQQGKKQAGKAPAQKSNRPNNSARPQQNQSGRHTLLLLQKTAAAGSRSWSDYRSVPAALDGFINSLNK